MARHRRVTEAMIDAAYRIASTEAELPFMARISNYTDPITGKTDKEALRAADADADRKNRNYIRRLLTAAEQAYVPKGRPRKEPTK